MHDSFQIEYNANKNDFAFRLIYNGKIITSLIDGCPKEDELCDTTVLEAIIKPLLDGPWDCDSFTNSDKTNNSCDTVDKISVWRVLMVAIISAVAGSFGTILYLQKRQRVSYEFKTPRESTPILYDSTKT